MKIKSFALAALLCAAVAHAAGNIGQSLQKLGETGNYALTFYLAGDVNNGSMPTTVAQLPPAQGNRILQVEIVPGVPAPTSGFSVQIIDAFGADIMGGLMASVNTGAPSFYAATSATPPLFGAFSIKVTGNSVAGAKATVVVFFGPTTLVNASAGAPGPAGPAGPSGATGAAGGGLPAGNYIFTPQTPGGSLIIGNNTVNLAPVPLGVNGTDAGHYLYVSAGVGTAEPCLITGGSAAAGANNGQVVLNCAHTHSGAWTVQTATAGIQEAIQTAQTAGGGIVDAAAPNAQLDIYGAITLSGSHVTLKLSGQGLALHAATIVYAVGGADNSVIGAGNTPVTATATTADAIAFYGCHICALQGLFIDRTATPAASGANGVHVVSGTNDNLKVMNISARHHYINIAADVMLSASVWMDLDAEYAVSHGIQFAGDNDEHLANVVSDYNGGHGIMLGKGTGTSGCIGGFRLTNAVTFLNSGDGLHIEGDPGVSNGNRCVYVFINNLHADTDTNYELYAKNAGAVSISNSRFVNGKGLYIIDNVDGLNMSNVNVGGSAVDSVYIGNGAKNITAANMWLGNSNASYYNLHVANGSSINWAGTTITQGAYGGFGGGVKIDAGSSIRLNGMQFYSLVQNWVTIAGGLTDVFVDAGQYSWQHGAVANSWTDGLGAINCRVEDNGASVRITGIMTPGTTADGTLVATMPSTCWPSVLRALSVVTQNGGGISGSAEVTVGTDGKLSIYGFGANSYLRVDGTYALQ